MAAKPIARDLRGFTGRNYDKGRPVAVQALWFAVSHLVFQKWWCPSRVRVEILRRFGAHVGERVLIRQRVRVHWPWKLRIGSDVWIGEGAWLLNLEEISIGDNVCISQEAFLCTGSHDPRSPTMEFDNAEVVVHDGAWVGARALVLRGSTIEQQEVVPAAGTVRTRRSGQRVPSPPA